MSSPMVSWPASTSRVPSHSSSTRKTPENSTPSASMTACQMPAETPAARALCDWVA